MHDEGGIMVSVKFTVLNIIHLSISLKAVNPTNDISNLNSKMEGRRGNHSLSMPNLGITFKETRINYFLKKINGIVTHISTGGT